VQYTICMGIDLVAVDDEGRCVIELKRGRTPRDIVAQALDYVSWVAELPDSEVRDRIARNSGLSFQRGVPKAIRSALPSRAIEHRPTDSNRCDGRRRSDDSDRSTPDGAIRVDINVVNLSYFSVSEQELLARTWVVDPAELLG
jgi:hypothetical protein